MSEAAAGDGGKRDRVWPASLTSALKLIRQLQEENPGQVRLFDWAGCASHLREQETEPHDDCAAVVTALGDDGYGSYVAYDAIFVNVDSYEHA